MRLTGDYTRSAVDDPTAEAPQEPSIVEFREFRAAVKLQQFQMMRTCQSCQARVAVCPIHADAPIYVQTSCLKAQGFTRSRSGLNVVCYRCKPFVQCERDLYAGCEQNHGLFQPSPMSLPLEVMDGLQELNRLINLFWLRTYTVTWHTLGGGGWFPSAKSFKWRGGEDGVKQMARLDFQRGKAQDDKANVIWDSWARRLDHVQNIHDMTPGSRAQWMESMVGVSYAAATNDSKGSSVVPNVVSLVEFVPPDTRQIAGTMWVQFQRMGLQVSS